MLPTPAKRLIRNLFYLDFLPRQIAPELIKGGNYLTLLGEEEEELKVLAQLGVAPNRVFSVENNLDVYRKQLIRSMREPGPALYYGELTDYVRMYLQQNQRFLGLNLDIYGTYWDKIDPVMTEILLFARRNPRTVVATYSCGGRDRGQLKECLKSLAICLYLAPHDTAKMVNILYGRYIAAGLSKPVSTNMVLRHLFWIRSHMEHIIRSQIAMGTVEKETAQWFCSTIQGAWQQMVDDMWAPITYENFGSIVAKIRRPVPAIPLLDLRLVNLEVATYTASGGFYHIGWFTTYQPGHQISVQAWLAEAMAMLTARPLWYANNKEPETLKQVEDKGDAGLDPHQIIWDDNDYRQMGRILSIPEINPLLASLVESLPSKPQTISDEEAREKVRQLARDNPGITTNEVIAQLEYPLERLAVTSLIAGVRAKENTARKRVTEVTPNDNM